MMSLLAMPTPSKSTDFTIYVYWRDKKKRMTQMYCIKTKTSYCIQPSHKFSLLFCSLVESVATDRSSRQNVLS